MEEWLRNQEEGSEATQDQQQQEAPLIPGVGGTTGRRGEWCFQSLQTGAIWWELEPRWGCPAEAGAKEGWDAWWQLEVSHVGNTAAAGVATKSEVGDGEEISQLLSSSYLLVGQTHTETNGKGLRGMQFPDTEQSRK